MYNNSFGKLIKIVVKNIFLQSLFLATKISMKKTGMIYILIIKHEKYVHNLLEKYFIKIENNLSSSYLFFV